MPVESEAQRRFMYATAEGKTDVDPSVGREFIDATPKDADLPERKTHPRRRRRKKKKGQSHASQAPVSQQSPDRRASLRARLHALTRKNGHGQE